MITEIKQYLEDHPDLYELSNEQIAEQLTALEQTQLRTRWITKRSLIGLFGPTVGMQIILTWRTAAEQDPFIAEVVDMMDFVGLDHAGIDVGDPVVRSMLEGMDESLLSSEQKNILLAQGVVTEPVFGEVYPGWIAKARAL